jgi:hypothetical protein
VPIVESPTVFHIDGIPVPCEVAASGRYVLAARGRNLESKAVQAAAATASDPGRGNSCLSPPRPLR